MNTNPGITSDDDAPDVSAALRDIAAWYRSDHHEDIRFDDASGMTLPAGPTGGDPGSRRQLLVGAAVALLVIVGVAAMLASGPFQSTTQTTASAQLGGGLDEETVRHLCLDIDTPYAIAPLRDSGTIHLLGDPATARTLLVITDSPIDVSCLVFEREGTWRRAVSVAGTYPPLESPDTVNVELIAELSDSMLLAGQMGDAVNEVAILVDGERYAAAIDDGRWGIEIPGRNDQMSNVPEFTVEWVDADGATRSGASSSLLPASPWSRCVEEAACIEQRLTELQALADALPDTTQAAALADGTVTQDEYRLVMGQWASCIAETADVDVTIEDGGLFTIQEANERSSAAFDTCKHAHADQVIEAVGIVGIEP